VSLSNFSSLAPDEEQRFVPFERAMRDNARRALIIGVAVAAALGVVLLAVCFGLYTPCNRFCARPPGPCRTPAQVSAWRASCESSCSALVHERGDEHVQMLNACVFSGSVAATCNALVKSAQDHGLWCEDGK
jgi:hypothetical protein